MIFAIINDIYTQGNYMKKKVLITGANKGLGLETALQLGLAGHTILITSRNSDNLKNAMNFLASHQIQSFGYIADMLKEDDRIQLAKNIALDHDYLDILINNAGIQLDFPSFMPGNSSETVSQEVLKNTFEVNLFAPIHLTQLLLPLLKKSSAGRIVNVSSIMGSLALHADTKSPIYGIKLLAYNSSKTALNQFTIHLSEALNGTNIRVNSAHPGWVKTDLGGEYAPMSLQEGVKTILDLTQEHCPHGSFIHDGNSIPW